MKRREFIKGMIGGIAIMGTAPKLRAPEVAEPSLPAPSEHLTQNEVSMALEPLVPGRAWDPNRVTCVTSISAMPATLFGKVVDERTGEIMHVTDRWPQGFKVERNKR